ncbi:MAG: hypothetical protein RJA36_1631 [Pseudomonadota bacterium]
MAKTNTARAADLDDDDRDDAPPPQRSTSKAGSKPPPATSAAPSVFALGAKAKPVRQQIDISAIKITSNVPVPPPQVGKGAASPYATLLARMKPGDMVELPYRQGYGLLSMAKKMDIKVTRRTLAVGVLSIWRV